MSELIDSFDRLKAEELHKTQAAQKEIVRLLQTLARKLEHMENPSRLNADRLAEMKSDLDFKQMQMGNSASTSERLGQELERRKQELQKIDTLDEKISVELRQLAERMVRARAPRALAAARSRGMRACAPTSTRRPPRTSRSQASMSSELDTYRDLKSLKETSRRRREELSAAKQQAIGRSGGLKEEARRARARHDELSSRLTADALAVELDELEQVHARATAPRRAASARRSVPSCAFEPAALPPRRCGRTKSASSRRPTSSPRGRSRRSTSPSRTTARALCAL